MAITREEMQALQALGMGGAYPNLTALTTPMQPWGQGLFQQGVGGIIGALGASPEVQLAQARAANTRTQVGNALAALGVPGYSQQPLSPLPGSPTASMFSRSPAGEQSPAAAPSPAAQPSEEAMREALGMPPAAGVAEGKKSGSFQIPGAFDKPTRPSLDSAALNLGEVPSPDFVPSVMTADFREALAEWERGAPEEPKTASRMEKLAALFGGAAGGAAKGLQTTHTGAVIGGAGAGAQQAVGKLRTEEREQEQRYQTQRQIHLRTGTALMAQSLLAEQQASVANAQLGSAAMDQRQRAQMAENSAKIEVAKMDAANKIAEAQMQWNYDLAMMERFRPQVVNTALGLKVITYDPETGNPVVTDTDDSVFMRALKEFEALAALAEATGMKQTDVLIGFEEVALSSIPDQLRPKFILAAAMAMDPEAATVNGVNLVELATANAVKRNPDFEMMLETASTPAASDEVYSRTQLGIIKELMGLMNDDDIYKFSVATYGGIGLPQQLLGAQGIAGALGAR